MLIGLQQVKLVKLHVAWQMCGNFASPSDSGTMETVINN